MFNSFQDSINTIFKTNVSVVQKNRIHGGDINRALKIVLNNGKTLFVKINSFENAAFFEAETESLEIIRKTNTIGVPKVLGFGTDNGFQNIVSDFFDNKPFAFLILEYLEPAKKNDDYWGTFGRELALMHKTRSKNFKTFGFFHDNFIGYTKQINTPCNSWISFFRDYRLLPQIEKANMYFDAAIQKRFTKLLDNLEDFLSEPQFPNLLHGDLWSGNIHCGPDGKAWILDPACYYGHSEADIAMTQLFGNLPSAFYAAYNEINNISKDYADRRDLYNLYQLLNHLNMFGHGYYSEVICILNRYS